MSNKRMNFVFFFPDEMRASSVSCYGNKIVQMPNYDRLANEGVRFESCTVQNPFCSPSRCSLMTGWYVHNMGHRSLWHLLRSHEPSMFRYLKNSGYDIGWYGKNDLYSSEYLDEICDDIDEKRNGYKTEPTRENGHVHKGRNPYEMGDMNYYTFLHDPIPHEEDKIILDPPIARAIDYLEARKENDKPFMLFLPTSMPHPPYNTLEKYHNMYDADKMLEELIKPEEVKGKPSYHDLIRKYRNLDKVPPEVLAKIYAVYLGMNSYVDLMLGELLDTLDRTGLAENTTVIVSSDHGDWAGNYGLVEKWSNALDDNIVQVPLIIKTPGNKAGHVVRGPVELFDIMPTVLELAGIKPEHTHFAQSLVSQLKGAEGDLDRAVFSEGGFDTHEPHCFEGFRGRTDTLLNPGNIYYPKSKQQQDYPESVCRASMVRTLKHKLVKRTSGENELYDLNKDPKELINLYSDPEYTSIKAELETKMLDWYIHTSDVTPFKDDSRNFKSDK